MESTPISATYQVLTTGFTANPAERMRRLGQAMGLWDKEFNFELSCRQIFRGFDFRGATMLEVGCGKGLFCLWAALQGAKEAIGLDQLVHDAGDDQREFQALAEQLQLSKARISHCRLQDYNPPEDTFDLVLSISSINFLDEKSCVRLRESPLAVMAYERLFRRTARMIKPGGKLIIVDAARHNFFGDLGFRNPASPCVDWVKHHQPEYWAELLRNCGFGHSDIRWTTGRFLRDMHIPYLPKSLAYFAQSTFRLEMTRVR
jgi:cyclopropane fatty-acyl-phospholipid synthase-like methyltransferase